MPKTKLINIDQIQTLYTYFQSQNLLMLSNMPDSLNILGARHMYRETWVLHMCTDNASVHIYERQTLYKYV